MPKVFVGTLYSGESDYVTCLEHLQGQMDVEVTHFMVSHLPEKEAHEALWAEWRRVKADHDLFVKLDADVVLHSAIVLSEIHRALASAPGATGLQAPLNDFMTDREICGLNAYAPTVEFARGGDPLFCDRGMDVGNTRILRGGELPETLRPAGLHCFYANERQGFHYGVHRMMKAQKQVMLDVAQAFAVHCDRVRGFALIGAVSCGKFMAGGKHAGKFSYTDAEFRDEYAVVEKNYDRLMARTPVSQFVQMIEAAISQSTE